MSMYSRLLSSTVTESSSPVCQYNSGLFPKSNCHRYLQQLRHLLVVFPCLVRAGSFWGKTRPNLGPGLCRRFCNTLRTSCRLSSVWGQGRCHRGRLAAQCAACLLLGSCELGGWAAAASQWLGKEAPE